MKLVIGLGISGKAVAAYWLKRGIACIGVDRKSVQVEGMEVVSDLQSLEGIDQVVVSPGVPLTHPLVRRAKEAGIEVVGEVEFALSKIPNRCVGITGTNGKTTATLLVEHVLKSAGKKVRALGNVGKSLTGYLEELDQQEILVIELSSYQLETLQTRRLEAAAILNLTPDHLDRYASMEEYAAAKLRIQECLIAGGRLFVSEQVAKDYGKALRECTISSAIAKSLCMTLGVSEEEFVRGEKTFCKPPHRIEWVAEIDGIAYYNDSKATNLDSVLYAVALFERPLILLAGGVDKGASYRPWIEAFRGKVKKILAFGQAAPLMEKELAQCISFERVATLEEAVMRARQEAKRGDVVLLSPGCSSFDQFRNYEHRGEEFKRIVKKE